MVSARPSGGALSCRTTECGSPLEINPIFFGQVCTWAKQRRLTVRMTHGDTQFISALAAEHACINMHRLSAHIAVHLSFVDIFCAGTSLQTSTMMKVCFKLTLRYALEVCADAATQ